MRPCLPATVTAAAAACVAAQECSATGFTGRQLLAALDAEQEHAGRAAHMHAHARCSKDINTQASRPGLGLHRFCSRLPGLWHTRPRHKPTTQHTRHTPPRCNRHLPPQQEGRLSSLRCPHTRHTPSQMHNTRHTLLDAETHTAPTHLPPGCKRHAGPNRKDHPHTKRDTHTCTLPSPGGSTRAVAAVAAQERERHTHTPEPG
jgi:hypothetical protein